jgi:D-xylose transport system ATP-binding protein
MNKNILETNNITKEFPGVLALDDVSIALKEGTILGLVGENGAGKSTLIKILSGAYPYGTYSGNISIDGEHKVFKNERDAEKAGIAVIYQELMLFPELTIAENIALPTVGKIVSKDEMHSLALKYMNDIGLDEDPETFVKNIGVGKQQLVEIAKALTLNTRILILDEPSAALTNTDTEKLLDLLKTLRSKGVSSIYISHKIHEVLSISDDITVIRDGKVVGTKPASELDEKAIIKMMVGRDMTNRFPPKVERTSDRIVFEVKDINVTRFGDSSRTILEDINFDVREGEIVGIAGLMGAGRTELVNSIFGDFKGVFAGDILVEGEKVTIRSPGDAIKAGIGLLTEDRKQNGLNLVGTVENNIMIVDIDSVTKRGVIDENQAIIKAKEIAEQTKIKTPSMETCVRNLSGGNQQKVVIAKWLLAKSKILIFDEPTRGIDVGAKYEIYMLMNELKKAGKSIIMVSSELSEILGMSDRIVILNEGKIAGIMDAAEADEESIMAKLV